MTEGIRNQFVEHEFDVQPFDGLSIFHDADFVERWIKSEQHLNELANTKPKLCDGAANNDADVLNELFQTDKFGGRLVTVNGEILEGSGPFEIKKAVASNDAQFRFGQIKFIKIAGLVPGRPRIEQYRAAIKLLPLPDHADAKAQASYMLLENAATLEFSDTLTTILQSDKIDDVFNEILEDGRSFRSEKSYAEKTTGDQRKLLDERARQYAQRLAPLIDHRVPVMIDAADFRKFSTKFESISRIIAVNTRDMTPNQQARNMITGHLTKLAFSNSAIDDPTIAPHLVIENTHAREIYWVPISTDFDIWTL